VPIGLGIGIGLEIEIEIEIEVEIETEIEIEIETIGQGFNPDSVIEPRYEATFRSDSGTSRTTAPHPLGGHPNTQNICPRA
jgi:hypothetical protein